jgi:hypothetical protein
VAPQVAANLTGLLKIFNTISCQQILGSEAYKSGILVKGITAKHLAITYQSLSFMMNEIPFLQEQILCRVGDEKHAEITREFEIVQNDIDTHKTQLLNKLSNMLYDVIKKAMRLDPPAHYKTTTADQLPEVPPSQYVVQIVKSMNSLNKVISHNLTEESRKIIFTGVFPQFIDEVEHYVDQHFIDSNDELGFAVFKRDLKYLETEINELAKNISTGQAFINKIRDIQDADLKDFDLEEEEEEDEDEDHH